jgi:hypothetical protein
MLFPPFFVSLVDCIEAKEQRLSALLAGRGPAADEILAATAMQIVNVSNFFDHLMPRLNLTALSFHPSERAVFINNRILSILRPVVEQCLQVRASYFAAGEPSIEHSLQSIVGYGHTSRGLGSAAASLRSSCCSPPVLGVSICGWHNSPATLSSSGYFGGSAGCPPTTTASACRKGAWPRGRRRRRRWSRSWAGQGRAFGSGGSTWGWTCSWSRGGSRASPIFW